jgi:hypothetical protein
LLPSDFPEVKEESFLQGFSDFVDKGLIDPGLRSSYGTWYMEREVCGLPQHTIVTQFLVLESLP